jgi:NAD(P)-dependent dehydrogenase (short-subunit alcohol dehydrogenase family)
MDTSVKKTVLITGASSGIGKACASFLVEDGHRVYGTYRSSPPPPARKSTDGTGEGSLAMIRMDVADRKSVIEGIECILSTEHHIDVVINSAGSALAGALEDTIEEEAKTLFETNLWGVHRVCRAVLPAMRERRSGLIINISSIAGIISLPYQGFYCAGKFALEAMTEALRMEVRSFGIRVVLIEPGDLATGLTAKRTLAGKSSGASVYAAGFKKALEVIEYEETHGYQPESVARTVRRIMRTPSPRLRYRVGSPLQKSSVWLKKILPPRLFEWIIRKFYKEK